MLPKPIIFAAASILIGASLGAQPAATAPDATADVKIADASRAGPAGLLANATILDWPAGEGKDFTVLRQGTNGWVCLPDHPGMPNDEPMCLDEQWMGWLRAFVAGKAPDTKGVGLSYMLNTKWSVSNTDPMAQKSTADNHWHSGGSHLMLIVPDLALLKHFPTEPRAEEPYVMWHGTPYAHLMIPIPEKEAEGSK